MAEFGHFTFRNLAIMIHVYFIETGLNKSNIQLVFVFGLFDLYLVDYVSLSHKAIQF